MKSRQITTQELKIIDVFSEMSHDDLKVISNHILWQSFSKGEMVLRYHELSNEVYFLVEGDVRATTYSVSGKEISYQDLPQGSMFGELSALDNQGRITSIITLGPCLIGKMSAEHFIDIIHKYPSVNHKVMLRLTGLIRFLCSRIYEFSAMDVKDRIRAEIVRQARLYTNDSKSALIEKMPTHEEIANKISTHREAVTKEFGSLVKENLIEKRGRKIFVPNIEKLSGKLFEDI